MYKILSEIWKSISLTDVILMGIYVVMIVQTFHLARIADYLKTISKKGGE